MVHVRTARLTQADGSFWTLDDGRSGESRADWIVEDVAGWYGGAGVRAETVARLQHGDFPARAWREGRSMTLHGVVLCVDSDERDWQERNISGMAWDGRYGELECDDGNAVLSTSVRLDGAPQVVKIGITGLRFQLPLKAASPFLFGEWRDSIVRPVGAGVGLEYSLFHRDLGKGPVLTFGTAIDTTEPIWNDGNAVSYPRFKVTADAPGGFAITLNGKRVAFPWPVFSDAPVVVDMSGSVTVSGVDQSHLLSDRGWGGVEPGEIAYPSFDLLRGGTGWATVQHRDTYI